MSGQMTVGITGHYGAGRSTAAALLAEHFELAPISMSSLLRGPDEDLSVSQLQQRGDTLRRKDGNEGLAKMAREQIGQLDAPGFVVDGIKHPDEARFLAEHTDFVLLAILAGTETRWQRTKDQLNDHRSDFDAVDRRDNRETDQWGVLVEHGQRVADCLLLADAIIWNDAPFLSGSATRYSQATLAQLTQKVTWFFNMVSNPGIEAPSMNEVRMCQAYTVAKRSSCLQRQVGAVITNPDGRILAEGYNEVPRDQPSCEDLYGKCYRKVLRAQDLTDLSGIFACHKCGGSLSTSLECTECEAKHAHLLPARPNLDYCRALHAEENAILQTSRYGAVGVAGGTIYTTTFPCALCAKKIVECGIARVVFTEPYYVEEAVEFFRAAETEVQCFEGFTQRAFQRVFER